MWKVKSLILSKNVKYHLWQFIAGVEKRENFLIGHKFNNLLKSVSLWDVTMVHSEGNILTFQPSRLPENVSLALKRETNSSENIKIKLTLFKNVSKVVHFTDFFYLCM